MTISSSPSTSLIETTIRQASRRRLLVETAEQLGLACCIAFGGLILLLLLGTEVLGGYWFAFLIVVGLIVAAIRVRERLISPYHVAQLLDRRLALQDALSTAHFLIANGNLADDLASQYQLQHAGEIARTVHPADAFPFRTARVWAVTGALLAVNFGLFAVRYLVTSSMSLRSPLVSVQIAPVVEHIEEQLGLKSPDTRLSALNNPLQSNPAESGQAQQNSDRNSVDDPSTVNANTDPSGSGNEAKSKDLNGDPKTSGSEASSENRAENSNSSQAGDPNQPQPSKEGASAQKTADSKNSPSKDQNSAPGLMDRMKDTLSSLMQKMQPNSSQQQNTPGNSQKSSDENKPGQQASAAGRDQQSSQQKNGQNQQSDQNQSAEGQAQGQTAEKPQSAQGHASDQSAQKGSDAHSGVGRQDGAKEIRDAEQLKAMGKLAEIIGKRSANLTGEMTVETSSSKQQLRTGYSQRVGQHSDSSGEINRNEVPLMYQHYVREYMEQVRKQDKENQ